MGQPAPSETYEEPSMDIRKTIVAITAIALATILSGCAWLANIGEEFNRQWHGVSATLTSYNEEAQAIDRIHGTSFKVSRDTRFDTSNDEGGSNNDSQVLLISLGDNHVSHVGSTLLLAQDGLNDIMTEANATLDFVSTKRGTPWLNNLRENHQNLWRGKAKTLMIRSQNGTPLAVFSGDTVEVFSTDVPKSTQFRVDGKYLFVYRADYTVVDTELLEG